MRQQIDGAGKAKDHADLDKRLAVVESAYATKDVIASARSELRGWLIAQTLTLVVFMGSTFTYSIGRMDAMERRLDQVELRLDRVEARLDGLEARMGKMEMRMERMEMRMDGIEERMEKLEEQMTAIEEQLRAIRSYMRQNPHR